MAAPFMIIGTMFYVAIGLLSRLAPQLQILFVIQPLQIVAGLIAFALLLATGLRVVPQRYAASFAKLTGG